MEISQDRAQVFEDGLLLLVVLHLWIPLTESLVR
jgi:hypothetical protein